ncbi:tol-pal system protein YbgF [Pantoea sp. Mhis]|uniref:tol-pal system protein YbgF n=1 Tax=Pantoea sp. Mhis TaxID=2576759 RepID=UPI00135B7C19|nr:tol-pal system protein YbgF [Pantoea sp. Mhis]MXP56295.1 tol-pal system protein YbgF [Pantoea sp. Mhis]
MINKLKFYILIILLFCISPFFNIFIKSWNVNAQILFGNFDFKSINNRVNILEQISKSQAQLLQEQQQEIDDNKNDINLLRGQIQQNTHQINQLVQNQQQLNNSIDILNTRNNRIQLINNDIISYNDAIELILNKKEYDDAINKLQVWVKQYPNSVYQPNANYWLGQLFYNKGDKNQASHYFATIIKHYPKSSKTSEALLKIGIFMQEKNDIIRAKAIYRQIIKQFPNTDSSKQAQKYLSKL